MHDLETIIKLNAENIAKGCKDTCIRDKPRLVELLNKVEYQQSVLNDISTEIRSILAS